MRAFSGVELRVALQIVKTSETSLTCRAFIRLFLAVCQQMTLEVVVSREIGSAVRTLVTLGRRRFGAVLVAGQAHLPRWRARIMLWL